MNPVKFSLRYPQVTIAVTLLLFVAGMYALLTMPRREDPKITIRMGLVAAYYPGANAEQVEKQVAKKIEEHLFRFEEVRKSKTYSTSRDGVVMVNVQLEDWVKDTDKFWDKLRHDMNEVRARELPQGVLGPIVNSDFGDTVAVLMALRGSHYGYRELKDYASRIEDELRTLRAVSKIKRYGEQKEQILVTSSSERISRYALDLTKIIGALQQRNIIEYAGKIDTEHSQALLKTSGLFESEDQIRRVMVDVSRTTGQPVYIGDLANVERRYADPEFLTRFDGEKCLMLSVEMQEGNNIVDFGNALREKLDHVRPMLPPDLRIDLIADQPAVVQTRISHFIREFGIAIVAVILVTMLLLPMRAAVIAALAIPITVAVTFGVMNALGIELHQVSISALIVVLGMVVDDAIVIADNYVELLDRKVPRADASWRSATELAVPVLTATLTIIAAFLPLLLLTGSVGEFISALPITVAVALGSSFLVAMLVTPLFCRFFIHKGLHDHGAAQTAKSKFSPLDLMQAGYGKTIGFFLPRKALAVALGIGATVGGFAVLHFVPEQFFPSAERNQFVIDVWLPEGARIETTDAVVRRIEDHLRQSPEVADYASFVGQSAPRFYYNVNPEQPADNYGQLLVNTRAEEETPALVHALRRRLAVLAPEAVAIVKELQQGEVLQAPIEIRISGDDIPTLKTIGRRVRNILRDTPGSAFVNSDYHEDSYRVQVRLDNEVANRLGLTNDIISKELAGGLDGAPVSTFWEGDRAVDIVLRLDANRRRTFESVLNTYMISTLTGARVPLREVALLQPQWETSRIVRRNGVRTLTVRSFFQRGMLASQVLNKALPQVQALSLPPGYRITTGGEVESQKTTFGEMVKALGVSLVMIFLILLFQFRSLTEPLIVMCSIPLALMGAALGLFLTHNPFGFTAFMGIISLSGIVVRNAIILVDYINGRRREGVPLEEAAREAGERRLRPIFLTTMAAAVGVTPMILSGSSLWSPLASVIAVGLLFSMFFTLVVVPVLFVLIERRSGGRSLASLVAFLLVASFGVQAQTRRITLDEAVDLALKNNSLLKIARQRVVENRGKARRARANYFPQLSTEANLLNLVEPESLDLPMGALGVYPSIGPVPLSTLRVIQGADRLFYLTTTLDQPLTQLFRIHAGAEIAKLDTRLSEDDVRKAENEVAAKVHEAYFGLLIAQLQKHAAQLQVAAAEERIREARTAVKVGDVLEVAEIGRRAALLQQRQALLAVENQISDVEADFNDLLGLPIETEVELVAPPAPEPSGTPLSEYLRIALAESPDVQSAEQTVEKARQGVTAARAAYIPDFTLFGQHAYQNGVPFLARNNGVLGLRLTWDVFDWGKREGILGERKAQLSQAEENLRHARNRIQVEVEKAYRKLDRSRQMIDVAQEAAALRREAERISANQRNAGVVVDGAWRESSAETAKAEADLLAAQLAYRLAEVEMQRTIGHTPR